MKYAILGDTHWGVRNDDPNFLKYFKSYYKEYFFPLLARHNINGIIHLGDVFDRRKYINFNTLAVFNEYFMEQIVYKDLCLHVIPGNHDIYFKNTNDVNALNTIYKGRWKHSVAIYEQPIEIFVTQNTKVLYVPWVTDDNRDEVLNKINNSDAKIMLCHMDMSGFVINAGKLSDKSSVPRTLLKKFDLVLSGHYHTKQQQDNIHYLGSPYELNWGDYNTNKGIHIVDFDQRTLEFIPNDHRLHHKIVYNNKYDIKEDLSYVKNKFVKVYCKTKVDPIKFEMFLETLAQQGPFSVEVEDEDVVISDEIDEKVFLENAGSTINMIKTFVNSVNISDEEKLEQINYLVDKYNEAINYNEDND